VVQFFKLRKGFPRSRWCGRWDVGVRISGEFSRNFNLSLIRLIIAISGYRVSYTQISHGKVPKTATFGAIKLVIKKPFQVKPIVFVNEYHYDNLQVPDFRGGY